MTYNDDNTTYHVVLIVEAHDHQEGSIVALDATGIGDFDTQDDADDFAGELIDVIYDHRAGLLLKVG